MKAQEIKARYCNETPRCTTDELHEVLVAFFESQQQAKDDLCGEQREWHLPRLNKMAKFLMKTFPGPCGAALEDVKTPYD